MGETLTVTADELYDALVDDSGRSEVFREGRLDGPPSLYRVWRHDYQLNGWGEYVDIAPGAPEWTAVSDRLKANGDIVVATPIDRPWDGMWCRLRTAIKPGTEDARTVREDS